MTDFFYTLRRSQAGSDVLRLQLFLMSQGINLQFGADGDFGPATQVAVEEFQQREGLTVDGFFGSGSAEKALALGYQNTSFQDPIPRTPSEIKAALQFPDKPSTLKRPTQKVSDELFGDFNFKYSPSVDNPQRIRILGDWETENIVVVSIPQLIGMVDRQLGAPRLMSNGNIRCHRLAAPRILALFSAWETAGFIDRVLYYVGCFNARLKRGTTNPSRKNLSNHSWGSAFDINSEENWLGKPDAIIGARGCLRELVHIANEEGFYWGGHFGNKDGMHFEIAEL